MLIVWVDVFCVVVVNFVSLVGCVGRGGFFWLVIGGGVVWVRRVCWGWRDEGCIEVGKLVCMRVGGDVGMFVIVMRVVEVGGGGGGFVIMIVVWGEGSWRWGWCSVGIYGELCDNWRSKRCWISDVEGEFWEVGKNKGCW